MLSEKLDQGLPTEWEGGLGQRNIFREKISRNSEDRKSRVFFSVVTFMVLLL